MTLRTGNGLSTRLPLERHRRLAHWKLLARTLVGGQPGVDRHHIAQVLIEGAVNPSGEHRTVEVFSRPGAPVTDFETLFAATQPDTVADRGALDQDLVPLGDEPARVQADLARLGA